MIDITMVQKSTGFKVIIKKAIDEHKVLVEYIETNCLYSKGRKAIMYKSDLRQIDIFDFIGG